MEAAQSALIVPIPEAEPAVGPLRAGLDPAASWGVPAHVTILYPFVAPDRIDDDVLATVAAVVAAVPRFDVTLTHVEWFGRTVAWLAPRPADPFRDLTMAVWRRFPDTPPFGGAYDDVVPHLTIGQDAPWPVLNAAAEAVAKQLPITATVHTVRLITGVRDRGPWPTLHEFPLGGGS